MRIGDIVIYNSGSETPSVAAEANDCYQVAAIVTMTPQEWQPGYRLTDGTWVSTSEKVAQPKPGTVHLHVFWPVAISGQAADSVTEFAHVPTGTKAGTFRSR